MQMKMRALIMGGCLALAAGIPAFADTVSGKSDSLKFTAEDYFLGPLTVAAGIDAQVGMFTFDLNASINGNEFRFMDHRGHYGVTQDGELRRLNFQNSKLLVGFRAAGANGVLAAAVVPEDNLVRRFAAAGAGLPPGGGVPGGGGPKTGGGTSGTGGGPPGGPKRGPTDGPTGGPTDGPPNGPTPKPPLPSVTEAPTVVPLPASLPMFGAALVGVSLLRRRKSRDR
jgi:hypothetical protein